MATITIRDTDIKITDVLKLIANGYSYEQITKKHNITFSDIMLSARLAEDLISKVIKFKGAESLSGEFEFILKKGKLESLDEIRKEHPRAFEKWNTKEDEDLINFYNNKRKITEIGQILKRSPGSIKARLEKMGLIN